MCRRYYVLIELLNVKNMITKIFLQKSYANANVIRCPFFVAES